MASRLFALSPSRPLAFSPFFALFALFALFACSNPRPAPRSQPVSLESRDTPVVTHASVVAFWLAAADTLSEPDRRASREAFRRSNQVVGTYLSDTDIALLATVSDTVVIELQSGTRRVVMLSGLDFPFGYLLIEPGYAEEFHTGLTADDDLKAAIDDYFGLEADSTSPRHRIARYTPRRPSPTLTLTTITNHHH